MSVALHPGGPNHVRLPYNPCGCVHFIYLNVSFDQRAGNNIMVLSYICETSHVVICETSHVVKDSINHICWMMCGFVSDSLDLRRRCVYAFDLSEEYDITRMYGKCGQGVMT